jgi:hypothetical protein
VRRDVYEISEMFPELGFPGHQRSTRIMYNGRPEIGPAHRYERKTEPEERRLFRWLCKRWEKHKAPSPFYGGALFQDLTDYFGGKEP